MDTQRLLDEHRRAAAAEQASSAAALENFRHSLGTTPRERLSWLLDFAYRQDIDRVTEAERERLWWSLRLVSSEATGEWAPALPERETVERISSKDDRAKWARLSKSQRLELEMWRDTDVDFSVTVGRYKVTPAALKEAQQAISEAAEVVVGGRLYHRPLTTPLVVARLGPRHIPAPPTPRSRFVLSQWFVGSLADTAVMATLALIEEIPPTLLRRCPYQSDPPERMRSQAGLPIGACGHVFVGVKRQKWCVEHQEKARLERDARAAKNYRKALKEKRRRRRRTR